MSISGEELKKEKEYLTKVLKITKELIDSSNVEVGKQKKNIYEMKKFMWENASDFTDEELVIEMNNRDIEVGITNEQIKELNSLYKSLESPYFGKVVFESKKLGETMPIYIGLGSIMKDFEFYVFDWRAPVSSLFYNYEIGDAEYDAPMGKVEGNVLSKRQFKIQNGKLIRCFDSSINIDDEYLQEVLAKESSEMMQNIVSTIQKEQNEIIRNVSDDFLIVQGIAGSGKTSVALHRIAYLLYKQKNLASKNVLIFSPNSLFSRYISEVLPELGEENVMATTFYDFSKTILKSKDVESFTKYLERVYSNSTLVDKEVITKKMSDSFKESIDKFYEDYMNNASFKNGITIGEKTFSTKKLNELFNERWSDRNYDTKMEFIKDYIYGELKPRERTSEKRVYNALLKSLNQTFDIFEVYNLFLNSIGLKEIDKNNVFYEDITPLLYLYFKIHDIPRYTNIKQIVIDEAQDYSKSQIELLNTLFPKASFTILGDINQTINPCYKYDSLKDLKKIREKSNYLELNKTYRSSEEIINYSNKVLNLKNVCSIRHNNNLPVVELEIDKREIEEKLSSLLQKLKENGFKKNAIITKNIEEAIYLSNILSKVSSISLVNESKTNESIKGNIIIPSYLSKGLEFDGVIAYTDKDNAYINDERNLYYVVLTRAQHQLFVCNQNKSLILKK